MLGAVEMAKDLGATLKARLRYDATAGAGIASRRGVGRVRHLHTPCLWLQKHIQDRRIELMKVDGLKNVADVGTKRLDSKSRWKCVNGMGVEIRLATVLASTVPLRAVTTAVWAVCTALLVMVLAALLALKAAK